MSGRSPAHRPGIVLGSGSPRRRELLRSIGVEFEVRRPDVAEQRRPAETPADYVLRLAAEKAAAVVAPGELAIAADTVVVLDGEVLEKPRDDAEAASMLHRLQGREHTVLTGVAVREADPETVVTGFDQTAVRMRAMTESEIAWYVATGEPADKAGSYALQGIGAIFVQGVTGSSSNVIGLPMALVYDLFARVGHDLTAFSESSGVGAPVGESPTGR